MTKKKIFHPCLDENGERVLVKNPTESTSLKTWLDARRSAIASRTDAPQLPAALNEVAFDEDFSIADSPEPWFNLCPDVVEGEPDFVLPPGFRATSGCVVVEPDQRAWVVYPTNAFGGVICSFPKGRLEPVLSLAQNAAKETWEESGLLVRPVHFLCDIVRRHVVTRFYLALRITGSPVLAGWESQAVGLVPVDDLTLFLNREYDRKVVPYVAALLSNSAGLFSSFGKALQQPWFGINQ